MRKAVRLFPVLVVSSLFAAAPAPAYGATGGASAESAEGGPLHAGALPYGAPIRQRPVARMFRVTPARAVEGSGSVRLSVRIDQRGVKRVSARVVAVEAGTGRVGARFSLGSVRTGRTVTVKWPAVSLPGAGDYVVRLHAKDPQGATLARAARSTGKSRLLVRPRPRPESSQPEPPGEPTLKPPPSGSVFPVVGLYSFGGLDARFGAGRKGHSHEGQDVVAAEGTPLVSPLAGTVRFVQNQPSGAGWYIVLDADDGRSLFFAHLQAGSIVVTAGQRVAAAQPLARVGNTGSSTGPHLHFEIWIGGWRDRGGTPIDPLSQLRAWATGS